jgi:hypothetical protein
MTLLPSRPEQASLLSTKRLSGPFLPDVLRMLSFFIACAVLGALILVVQIVVAAFGFDHSFEVGALSHAAGLGEGMELLSVRSLAAGTAAFGIGGMGALSLGMPAVLALAPALAAGAVGLIGSSYLMRQVLRLESDGTLRIENAVGSPATVYLSIPAGQRGAGKVHLALQGRTLEIAALTSGDSSLPTGTPVVVVAVIDSETVEVLPTSIVQEALDVDS